MITDKEIQAASLSTLKKDFYQIWNELIDTAGKISERWDPSSTNESDPGIVLLKVLTAVADKLNYNIDKNTLEAFMPSATQEESMRKLCEMMGYNMRYYRSATTPVTITYTGDKTTTDDDGNTVSIGEIAIPKFSTVTNTDNDIIYTLLEDAIFYITEDSGYSSTSKTIDAIEGQVVECTTEQDNLVTLNLLDDNFRYVLPESAIAENGVFVYNTSSGERTGSEWTKVDNLNTIIAESKVYKFGFDSKQQLPYIQFPEDISALIGDGLKIYYVRTNGANGNISAKTLTSLVSPEFQGTYAEKVTAENFNVANSSATTNGKNIESLNDAYNSYKKTIGTFDTLVTCRDYMNKIYQLETSTTDTTPLVSNDIVADIRDDINRAITLCEFSDTGIKYVDKPLLDSSSNERITHFDLMLYPFKTVYGLNNKSEYVNSFKYNPENKGKIETELEEYKTISHKFNYPDGNDSEVSNRDITCIKNYLKLNAKITTTYKVNSAEEAGILSNIYVAIYENFNARKIDFGEEIPYDTILSVIENADERIKNVSLEEPELYTAIQVATPDNSETYCEEYLCDISKITAETDKTIAKKLINRLILRNILAGKVKLFNYDDEIKRCYDETTYSAGTTTYEPQYPTTGYSITSIEPTCEIQVPISDKTLTEGEIISFRAPNYSTVKTYPAYVNYNIHIHGENSNAIPATFQTFYDYFTVERAADTIVVDDTLMTTTVVSGSPKFTKVSAGNYKYDEDNGTYYINLTANTFVAWNSWIATQASKATTHTEEKSYSTTLEGFYRMVDSADASRVIGELIDSSKRKFALCNKWSSVSTTPFTSIYIQQTHTADSTSYTEDGLGKDAELFKLKNDVEYELKEADSTTNKDAEWVVFNYTKSSTSDDSDEKTVINEYYGPGTIIKVKLDDGGITDTETLYKQGTSKEKTSGYSFVDYNLQNVITGMQIFGTNEQIEIRKPAEVSFYDEDDKSSTTAYVYWSLQDSSTTDELVFPFVPVYDEEGVLTGGKYSLKENEYFYYTDANKLEMAYYGYGSEIVKTGTFELKKSKTDSEISAEEVLTKGMSAIPWVTIYNLSDTKNITVKEYQYVNLTEGDKVTQLHMMEESSGEGEEENKVYLTAEYKETNPEYDIKYIPEDGVETTLPKILIDGANWYAASKLMLNINASTSQTLKSTDDKVTITEYEDPEDETGIPVKIEITPEVVDNEIIPVSIKSNYTVQSTEAKISTATKVETEDETTYEYNYCMGISKAGVIDPQCVKLNSFGENGIWHYMDFKDFTDTATTDIQINIPSADFGMIMFYYYGDTSGETITNRAYIVDTGNKCSIYNLSAGWWDGYTSSNNKYFRDGINIVKIEQDVKKLTIHCDAAKKATLIFSDLDCINSSNPINMDQIDYQQIDTEEKADEEGRDLITAADQLLADINAIDTNHDFYYNLIMDNSTALDLNENLTDEDEKETLTTPRILYDYNNVNNKFVISEISETDMRKGITIAKSSKL